MSMVFVMTPVVSCRTVKIININQNTQQWQIICFKEEFHQLSGINLRLDDLRLTITIVD